MDIDRETYERLAEVLYRIKEARYRLEQKRLAQLWKSLKTPLNLKYLLSDYTKDELSEIRQNLRLKGLSALKKQELLDALETEIPVNAHRIFLLFDDFRYHLARKIVENNGIIVKFDVNLDQIEYFRSRGIIFSGSLDGKKVLVMPPELISEFKKIDSADFRKVVRRHTEWIRLVQGLLFYYGALSMNQLLQMIEDLTETKITDPVEFLNVLFDAAEFYEEIVPDLVGFANCRVFDPERVIREHKQRPELDFYPFTYEQLYKAGAPGYVDKNFAFQRFSKFLADVYDISIGEAEAVVEECVYAVRIGEPFGNIIKFLQEQFEIDDEELFKEFVEHVGFLSNNTRQWFLKGYSPKELSQKDKTRIIPFPVNTDGTKPRVGRNDPCPCGSGKKYKKCCGRQ